jgi:hypothetical protein
MEHSGQLLNWEFLHQRHQRTYDHTYGQRLPECQPVSPVTANRQVKRGNFREGGIHEYGSQPPQLAPKEIRGDPEKKKNILSICDLPPLDHLFHHPFQLVHEREHHTCRIRFETLFNLVCIWI